MKEKIKRAVEELNGLGKHDNAFVEFNHKANDSDKALKGKVFFNSLGIMEMELTEITGYSTI